MTGPSTKTRERIELVRRLIVERGIPLSVYEIAEGTGLPVHTVRTVLGWACRREVEAIPPNESGTIYTLYAVDRTRATARKGGI